MANTGYKRSLTVEITKYTNGDITDGYPLTYNGLNAFTVGGVTWPQISEASLQNMSDANFNSRLAAFKNYISFREQIEDFDSTIQSGFEPVILDETTCTGVLSNTKLGDWFRAAYIRNTAQDNWNISVESRFKVASVLSAPVRYVLDKDIPDVVIQDIEQNCAERGWHIFKDGLNHASIQSIGEDKRTITEAVGETQGALVQNDKISFLNPWVNADCEYDAAKILTLGAAASWNEKGIMCGGMWKKENGNYMMIVVGMSATANPDDPYFASNKLALGAATSTDNGATWAYLNSGALMYQHGVGDFNLTVCSKGLYCFGNPILIDQTTGANEYLQFATMINGDGKIGLGWFKFDEDFVVTQVCSDLFSFSTFDMSNLTPKYSGGGIYYDGAYRVFFTEHPNTSPTSWLIKQATVNIDTMTITGVSTVATCSNQDKFEGKNLDLAHPMVFNNDLYLFISGVGKEEIAYSLTSARRTIGLMKKDQSSWVMDTRSPIIVNPISAGTTWDAVNIVDANQNLERGLGYLWGTSDTLLMFMSVVGTAGKAYIVHMFVFETPCAV